MRQGALFQRFELFSAAATIAAHANAPLDGFRQRDVRFIIELFTNWVETIFDGSVMDLKNTQVSRYLDDLAADGYARKMSRKGRPYYKLLRIGLIELLSRLTPGPRYVQPEQFFFLYYFVNNYRQRLFQMVEDEGKQFPLALKLEVETLLDVDALIRHQLQYAELELRKLEDRINDSLKGGKFASKLFAEGGEPAEVAQQVEQRYPYELNSQKPLSELISEVPEDIGRWELEIGAFRRVEDLWNPTRSMLQTYIRTLKGLTP